MNANGIARGYMIRNMDDFRFLVHVIEQKFILMVL